MNKKDIELNSKIIAWSKKVFYLPDSAGINVFEENYIDEEGVLKIKTCISVKTTHRKPGIYTILKPLYDITFEDIEFLKKSMENYLSSKHPLRSKIYKFLGWWFIFAGGITVFSICPVCGQMGCPVGIGTTGILAGIFALIKTNGKNFFVYIKSIFRLSKDSSK